MEFWAAEEGDLPAIIAMLADDDLGAGREASAPQPGQPHRKAFAEISADPNNELVVACSGGEVVGTMQLTFIPNLTYEGAMEKEKCSKCHKAFSSGFIGSPAVCASCWTSSFFAYSGQKGATGSMPKDGLFESLTEGRPGVIAKWEGLAGIRKR